jgi:hypothetical protein
MGRIRTIKPEFFKHSELYDLEIESGLPVRLAFAALWTVCDREGRFKWRPRDLKADCLPHDNVDFSRVLDALATRQFVERYEVGGEGYGYVPAFLQHQVINHRETKSKLPEPPNSKGKKTNKIKEHFDASTTRQSRDDEASPTRGPRVHHAARGEGKGTLKSSPSHIPSPTASGAGGTLDATPAPKPPENQHLPDPELQNPEFVEVTLPSGAKLRVTSWGDADEIWAPRDCPQTCLTPAEVRELYRQGVEKLRAGTGEKQTPPAAVEEPKTTQPAEPDEPIPESEQAAMCRAFYAVGTVDPVRKKAGPPYQPKPPDQRAWPPFFKGSPPFKPGSKISDAIAMAVIGELGLNITEEVERARA